MSTDLLPIGSVIVKKSRKTFKSGSQTGIVTGHGTNPNTDKPAYIVDATFVDAQQCELYDPKKIKYADKVVFHVKKEDDQLVVILGSLSDWKGKRRLSDFYTPQIKHIVDKIAEKFSLSEFQESYFEVADLYNQEDESTWDKMTNETEESMVEKLKAVGCTYDQKFCEFIDSCV